MTLSKLVLIFTVAFVLSCQKQSAQEFGSSIHGLRPMTTAEAISDFQLLANYFRTYYGPLEFKEQRFQFSFETWVSEIENELKTAKTDDQIFGLYAKFLSRFEDGHVGIHFLANSTGTVGYNIPIYIIPVQNTFVVENIEGLKGSKIARGDEILSIDGKSMPELLQIILKYKIMARAESNKHLIYMALSRSFYMTELRPMKNSASIQFRKADGTVLTEDFVWKVQPLAREKFVENGPLNFVVPDVAAMQQAGGASLMTMAKSTPFFASPEVLKEYQFQKVSFDENHRTKFGLAKKDKPDIFAAIYRYQGKNILLVRNHVYQHGDFPNTTYLKAYKAILSQWEPFVDTLVLDQTHNGGGSYCEEFFRLFIKDQKDAFVQALNVDRKWILDLHSWGSFIGAATGSEIPNSAFEAMSASVEKAYDAGQNLTAPMPIIGGRNKVTPADYTWKKPMLVLIDELAGSCGDAFPMLIKNNNVAKLFGANTMGLGGNVELVTLTHSRTLVSLTRGLFTSHRDDQTYTPERMIENNGVAPDYPYSHTLTDYRAGFTGYVREFSQKAIEQIPAAVTPAVTSSGVSKQ